MKINAISQANFLGQNSNINSQTENKTSIKNADANFASLPSAPKELLSVYQNISFTGKPSLSELKEFNEQKQYFTSESQILYDNACAIAKEKKSKNVTAWHLYLASLLSIDEYINDINSGKISSLQSTRKTIMNTLRGYFTEDYDIFASKNDRDKLQKILKKHIQNVEKKLDEEPKTKLPGRIYPSSELISELSDVNDAMFNATQTDTFYDNYFIAMLPECCADRALTQENSDLFTDISKAFVVEDAAKKKKSHIEFYDNKADKIWKNVDLGYNSIILCDTTDENDTRYFLDSFTNLINKPDQKYKNITPENTNVYILNKQVSPEHFSNIVESVKADKNNEGKTSVFVANFQDYYNNSLTNGLTLADFEYMANKDDGSSKSNVKFVFLMQPDVFYQLQSSNPYVKSVIDSYAIQTLPELNADKAKLYLTDKKGLDFISDATQKEFTKEAVEQAFEFTVNDEGKYPNKVISFLNAAAKFYAEDDVITKEHVEEYYSEIKNLSESQTSNNSLSKTIFNTGKNLSDIAGSPMTKVQAKSIAERIKNKRIGTKGFITYLEGDMSYGGGRRNTAEAIAGEAGIPMIIMNAKDFALKDTDTLAQSADISEIRIRKIVQEAKAQAEVNKNKAAMIFIENFDNFAANPLYGISSIYEQKAFSKLLDEMENTREENKVNLILVGSVNMPELIDTNILKPHKFLNSIIIYPPQSSEEREEVIDYYVNKMNLKIKDETGDKKAIKDLADTTQGFTVVDLMNLLETAENVSLERDKDKIDASDLTEAFLQVTTGIANTISQSDTDKKIVAAHEAGHALTLEIMNRILKEDKINWHEADEVNFITLDPRGVYGGATYSKDAKKNGQYNYEKLMAELISMYGGHSAEKEIFAMDGSWGISGDMQQASSLAKSMVIDMGMGKKTGSKHIEKNALGSLDVSESKRRDIEEDIDLLMSTAQEISDMILFNYAGFIIEFAEKYYSKAGTGDCIIPAETFRKELDIWQQKLPDKAKDELNKLKDDIKSEMAQARKPDRMHF